YYLVSFVLFSTDAASSVVSTLSLHDALPIFGSGSGRVGIFCHLGLRSGYRLGRFINAFEHLLGVVDEGIENIGSGVFPLGKLNRSEEHTSELQSRENLVCRLLLEKKKESRRY